jgi:hypothetical protein
VAALQKRGKDNMPVLPTYQSKQNIIQPKVSNAPAVGQQGGAEDLYKGTETILKGTEDIGTKWQTAVDTMDYTKAKANYETAIATVKSNAVNDPNPDNQLAHQKQLQDITKDFGNQFHNKELANKAKFELDHNIAIANMEIGNEFKKKQLFANKINIGTTIDNLVQSKINTTNPALKADADQQIFALVNAHQASGTITPAEAEKYLKDSKIIEVKYEIARDNSTTEKASDLLKALKDTKQYPDLTPTERLSLIEESQKRIFQNNQSYKKQVDNNEDAVTATLADKNKPQPSEQQIIAMMDSEQITPKFAKATIENLKSIKEKKENRSEYFDKASRKIITPGDTKPEDIRIGLLNANAAGDLSNEEFALLYTFNQEANNKSIDDDSPHKSFARSIIDWSDSNAGSKTIESRSRMFKDYMTQVNSGTEPETAVKNAKIAEIIRLHPAVATYPEEGQLVYDIWGNIKLIKNFEITNPKAKVSK